METKKRIADARRAIRTKRRRQLENIESDNSDVPEGLSPYEIAKRKGITKGVRARNTSNNSKSASGDGKGSIAPKSSLGKAIAEEEEKSLDSEEENQTGKQTKKGKAMQDSGSRIKSKTTNNKVGDDKEDDEEADGAEDFLAADLDDSDDNQDDEYNDSEDDGKDGKGEKEEDEDDHYDDEDEDDELVDEDEDDLGEEMGDEAEEDEEGEKGKEDGQEGGLRSGGAAFAKAFSNILGKSVPHGNTVAPIMASSRTAAARAREGREHREATGAARKLRLQAKQLAHVVPSVATDPKEKALVKIATRGVVRLFNAITKVHREKLARYSGGSAGKMLSPAMLPVPGKVERINKASFLAELKGLSTGIVPPAKDGAAAPGEVGAPQPAAVDDGAATWDVLRDDFMGVGTSTRMKDWDKAGDADALDDVSGGSFSSDQSDSD